MEHNNKLYSDEHDKANILNDYLQSQSFLNDKDVHLPAILPTSVTSDLNSIFLTTDEVESVLKILPVGKATGPNGLVSYANFHKNNLPLTVLFSISHYILA